MQTNIVYVKCLAEFSFDTTANSLAITCYYLARYTDVQKKLHEEIDEIFGSSDDSREVIFYILVFKCKIQN